MRATKKNFAVTGLGMASLAGLMMTALPSNATTLAADAPLTSSTATDTRTELDPLNNSPVHGVAKVAVDGRQIMVTVRGNHLLKGMPHAMHIHFGKDARHECPTVRDDDNSDHRLNTAEGIPAYGPVRTSLTTHGDTSPDSTLAVKRFPTAPEHKIRYKRTITVSKRVADAVANGKAVVVIHGIDYNGNGKYDFDGAGASELDPNLPAEATDPVACGVLTQVTSSGPLP